MYEVCGKERLDKSYLYLLCKLSSGGQNKHLGGREEKGGNEGGEGGRKERRGREERNGGRSGYLNCSKQWVGKSV